MPSSLSDSFVREVRSLWEAHRAKGHSVDLQPPATKKVIAAFERRHGVKLPPEYRSFLLELANGGGWLHTLADFQNPGAFKGIPGDFRKPFPHRRKWNLTAKQFARMPEEGVDDAGYAAFWKDYFRPERINGAIPICEGGCSRWYLLVLNGKYRGKVWIDERGSEAGIFPSTNARGETLGFAVWYLAYLKSLLHKKQRGWVI